MSAPVVLTVSFGADDLSVTGRFATIRVSSQKGWPTTPITGADRPRSGQSQRLAKLPDCGRSDLASGQHLATSAE
jgi:hypothetical protein